MRKTATVSMLLMLLPATALAQEMSAEEMVRQIRGAGAADTRSLRPSAPSTSRTLFRENGVDSARLPFEPPPPAPAAPAAMRPPAVPPNPQNCPPAVQFSQILFELGSARISSDEQTQKTILELARALSSPELAAFKFYIRGHTDVSGTVRGNLRLSQSRAEAIAMRLINGGVHPTRMQAYGLGSGMLIDAANPASFRNRRVDICAYQ